MKTGSPLGLFIFCLFVYGLLPRESLALPDGQGQRAGEISRVIPQVSIAHGGEILGANEKSPLYWKDVVNTQAVGRARVSLDDGSVLNLGSNSSMTVAKHDTGVQQTELAMGVGKMRVRAQKITQANGKFEVHTPLGVAGVIGTDFYVGYENRTMLVLVFAGRVRVCNLRGECVELGADQMTMIVGDGFGGGPTTPALAPPAMMSDAISSTNLEMSVETTKMDIVPLGIVTQTSGARIRNSTAVKGELLYSGDPLFTGPGGTLGVSIGTLAVKLHGGTVARIYRASYGAVIVFDRGDVEFKTAGLPQGVERKTQPQGAEFGMPGQPQAVEIVASDVRITPASGGPSSARVSIEVPCDLKIQNHTGQLYVMDSAKSRVIAAGKIVHFFPENYVSYREWISPDSAGYHQTHQHWACNSFSHESFDFANIPGNPNSGPTPNSVPEPSILNLMGIGFLTLLALKVKRLLA